MTGLTDTQIVARSSGIGGSESAAALGLSMRKSQLQLYLEKRGESPPMVDNAWLLWGRLLEPVIRQQYSEQTGRVVRVNHDTMRHPRYPFILGHPDGGTDDRRVFEAKNSRTGDGFGEPGTDQVPQDHLLQCQHYMTVTGFEIADLAVLIGGSDFRIYEIPADRELQEMIIEGEASFWKHVEDADPPEPNFDSPHIFETLKRLYPGTNGQRVVAHAGQEAWRNVYTEALERAEKYQSAADAAKAHLIYELGEGAQLVFRDGKVLRRKRVSRKGYTVEATEFIEARWVNDKEK